MPDALTEARTLIKDIKPSADDTKNLLYVGKLKERNIPTREVSWLNEDEDFGLAPVVSGGVNSPVVKQGDYRQFKSSPIDVRFAKLFTQDELNNMVSPDERYRIDAKLHVAREIKDMMRRALHTQEYIAHCAISRGAVKYVSSNPSSSMNVNLTFPIKTKTAAVLWSDATNGVPVTNMSAWLQEFEMSGNKMPEIMRMSRKTWDALRANAEFKAQFTSYLRTQGMNVGDVPPGLLTPEMTAKALGWPTIQLYNERTRVKFTAKNNETAGANVTIELLGEDGYPSTFGVNVGDKLLIRYSNGSWAEEPVVETVTDGVSVVADIAANITAGDVIVVKPTFHPEDRVTLITDEQECEFLLAPYGLEVSGDSIRLANWYGIKAHVFADAGEPNLRAYRRVWNSFGVRIADPKKIMSCKVL